MGTYFYPQSQSEITFPTKQNFQKSESLKIAHEKIIELGFYYDAEYDIYFDEVGAIVGFPIAEDLDEVLVNNFYARHALFNGCNLVYLIKNNTKILYCTNYQEILKALDNKKSNNF